MNTGIFLDNIVDAQPTNFCVGVAGYPEKHFEVPDMNTDIAFLQQKVNAGAEYVVTQMFFDNEKYFAFVDACSASGVTVPIIPGLKVITRKSQVKSVPEHFNVCIPNELYERVKHAPIEKVVDVGAAWTARQVEELVKKGVPSIHFYVMLDAKPVHKVLSYFKK